MNTRTELLEFLDNFFLKLERFPPGPGIVTYDRIKVAYRNPNAGLNLDGAIALARTEEKSGRIRLRLVFELGQPEKFRKPIQLDLKDSFDVSREGHLELARENMKAMVRKILGGFPAGKIPRTSYERSPAASGEGRC